ncbi:DUF3343 domain-containing protein [Aminipila luticellarii]|uniref:DUF3343 domain-containing protein n=1 Tax=Aminipila luticellarii TaxID=2507160 RepID=A0A410PVR6_9FIRM|nr:DUF3343 domain-containing protein [Aminipila luticellarii]QAT43008.1 DUF3343 domain-containing protein [Aminipila luticellarii]
MKKEYLLTFSSFYKAKYAQEKITELGVRCTVKRAPSEIVTSCGYAIYLKTEDINRVLSIFDGEILTVKGVFMIDSSSGSTQYRKISF